ncbi:MAG: aldo/keto reductase [Bacteroidota bacterium]
MDDKKIPSPSPESIEISRIIAGVMSWGSWGAQLDPKSVLTLIENCLEMGITTFDHADIYGDYTTEALFGRATQGSSALRQRMQLISKCGIKMLTDNRPSHRIKSYDTSKEHITFSVENSLRQLKTDYLDMLLIHRPSPLMQPEEIAETFTQLLQSGKVRSVGVSNFTPSQYDLLNSYIPLSGNQIEASLLHRKPFLDGTLDQLLKHQHLTMAYSSMAAGAFFAHPPSEAVQRIRFVAGRLERKHNTTFEQILTAWILRHPAQICPVMGSTKVERLQRAVDAQQIDLSREEWFMLWEAAVGEEVP